MTYPKAIQGGIYNFKTYAQCAQLGIPASIVPGIVRVHMVLVLNMVSEKPGFVRVMTVS